MGLGKASGNWRTGCVVRIAGVFLLDAIVVSFAGGLRWDATDVSIAGVLLLRDIVVCLECTGGFA